nr:MAG TPA: PORTAL PROTEIN, 15 PROTEIN, HEAD PROTEIN, TAILED BACTERIOPHAGE, SIPHOVIRIDAE.6A [Caudoviricetes sp.]
MANWSAGTHYYTGDALITSLTANANNGDNATYSVTLTGVSQIKKVGTAGTAKAVGK